MRPSRSIPSILVSAIAWVVCTASAWTAVALASLWAYGALVDPEFSWFAGRNTLNYGASDFPAIDVCQRASQSWGTRFRACTDIRITGNSLLHSLIPEGNDNTYELPGLVINMCPFSDVHEDAIILATSAAMPGYTAVAIFLLHPFAFLSWRSHNWWRASRRRKLGLCGYDLRESPGRCCSECGVQIGRSPPHTATSSVASRRNHVVSGLILAVAAGSQVGWIAAGLPNWQDAICRCAVPGRHRFTVDEPGDYLLYHENRTIFDGVAFSSSPGDMGRLPCTVRPEGGDEEDDILLRPPSAAGYEVYTSRNTAWRTIRQFHIDKPGTYVLEVWFRDWADGTKASKEPCMVLAIGRSRFRPFVPLIAGSWAIWALAVPAAVRRIGTDDLP